MMQHKRNGLRRCPEFGPYAGSDSVALGFERVRRLRCDRRCHPGRSCGAAGVEAVTGARVLEYSATTLLFILLNRTVMGFAIGASGLRLRWAWNGVVVGLVVGSISSYFLFKRVGEGTLWLVNFFVNGVFGSGIELFTTVVFKQKARGVEGGKGAVAADCSRRQRRRASASSR